ncbi:kyphoscoliosis peptidase [Aplochiton taeniatus]
MSAEFTTQKFSFPFSCPGGRPQPLQVLQPDPASPPHLKPGLKVSSIPGELQNGTQRKVEGGALNPPAEGGSPGAQGRPPPAGLLCDRAVFEKLMVVTGPDGEDQRPAAKRQLSSESAARTPGVVKKTAVRKDEEDGEENQHQPPRKALGQPGGGTHGPPRSQVVKKRSRKDLFSSVEVFHRVDTHAINAGAELKKQCVFMVQTIARRITQGTRNELERVRAIWVWLCHNIEYDVSGYLGQSEKLCTPEEVIEAGRGVCCGYSSLCAEMCREVGVQCLEVTGHSKGLGYQQGRSLQGVKSDHQWNAVQLEGQWFLMDACWGAGQVDQETQSFVKRFDDFYFLTDPEDFIESHYPDEECWMLLDVPIPLEEFERRVFKTSAFYKLGLHLIQPKHYHIVTDDGEASVSMSFSRPVTFTYEITQQGLNNPAHQDLQARPLAPGDSSSSSGLLTVSHRGMKLQLLPPASGTYDVKLFARPDLVTTAFSWVCSFTLECPTPRVHQELPENPFLSWGLQPVAEALGLVRGSLGGEAAVMEGEEGVFKLVLKTSRPLMVLCELVHPGLDPARSKRCLATQMEPAQLTCHVLCPVRGFYRLSLFLRDYHNVDGKFQNAANFLLHCKGRPVSVDRLFPPNLTSCCGPGTRALEAGLSKFSHAGALVSTQQGKCNITFHNQRDLEIHAVLARQEGNRGNDAERQQPSTTLPLTRHLLLTHNDSKVTVSASLPGAGVYRLGLYARTQPGEDFNPMCDFVLRNSCEQPGSAFPCTYAAWRKGCVLFEPRAGLLEPGTWVRFRVRVPGAQRVSVLGGEKTELKMNKSRVWEGEVFTGSSVQPLKVAAIFGESKDMAVIMTYDLQQEKREE